MKLYALYRIRNIEINMDYIGWSTDPISRVFEQHEKTNSYIGNAICSYGWDAFNVDVLHLVKTKEEVLALEIEEIVKHNCRAPNGYNLTPGGEGGDTFSGKHHTEETKEKLRKIHKGKQYRKGKTGYKFTKEHSENLGKAGEGRKHSKETLEKMRLVKLGKKRKSFSEKTKKKMGESKIGNQNAKGKNLGNKFSPDIGGDKNPMKDSKVVKKMLVTRYKNKIKKLEQELLLN